MYTFYETTYSFCSLWSFLCMSDCPLLLQSFHCTGGIRSRLRGRGRGGGTVQETADHFHIRKYWVGAINLYPTNASASTHEVHCAITAGEVSLTY